MCRRSPFWWLDQTTVQALLLALIASVYIGLAVADGRPKVIAIESAVTGAFVWSSRRNNTVEAIRGERPPGHRELTVAGVVRYWCTDPTATEPSPTAAATRLTDP
jgi:hypothetical protein